MLVDEHAKRDSVGVEAVQKVLDVGADEQIETKLLFIFNYTLRHSRDHIIVSIPDLNKSIQKAREKKKKRGEEGYQNVFVDLKKININNGFLNKY